jgi:DNA helicase-2/ATP-dependent DNA helicase PcrA
MDFDNILKELNPEQLDAVSETEGPLLVLAGAGTGKTKVLTTRIAYILYNQLSYPSQILSVTFTNKAAKEMEARIFSMVGDISAGLWLGTFHSICLRMLRKHTEKAHLKDNFAIINSDDQVQLIKQLIKDMNIDEKKNNPKALAAQINRWKDRALEPKDVVDGDIAYKVYEEYERRCTTLNVVDFGSIILKVIRLFKDYPEVLEEYRRRFKYIMVDEYQDTNVAQYIWLRMLALSNHNICCVGDDDQSIYGWRGAEVGNILRFEKDFEEAKVIRLETNYRSTNEILDAANSVINNNQNRLGKNLSSHAGSGSKIKLASVWDDRAEASFIADEIESLQQVHHVGLDKIAILVRAGYQTRAFEECFMRRAIAYRILGGLRFYERMEIRDAVAYVRAVYQPENDLALERIINTPKRGIGEKTLNDLRFQAREQNISLNEAIRNSIKNNVLKPKIHSALQELINNFDKWKKDFEEEGHVKVVEKILDESGYRKIWENEKTIEAKARLDNLKELSNALVSFRNIEEFLEHISLVSDNDDKLVDDMVSIMTIHAAKGLEFENLFLPGWEEGLFPSQQTIDEKGKEGLEEERRLAYVAITRAKKNLCISFAASRMVFGNIISSMPSRFVDEIPDDMVDYISQQGLGPNYKSRNHSSSLLKDSMAEKRPASYVLPSKAGAFKRKNRESRGSANSSSRGSKFGVGDKIYHNVFGYGRVLNVNGKHLQIVFEKSAIKTLLEDYISAA